MRATKKNKYLQARCFMAELRQLYYKLVSDFWWGAAYRRKQKDMYKLLVHICHAYFDAIFFIDVPDCCGIRGWVWFKYYCTPSSLFIVVYIWKPIRVNYMQRDSTVLSSGKLENLVDDLLSNIVMRLKSTHAYVVQSVTTHPVSFLCF